jgi:DNA-directed RNA polymerase specialized sigma24 family protein
VERFVRHACVSTRYAREKRALQGTRAVRGLEPLGPNGPRPRRNGGSRGAPDPADQVALVAHAKREVLLRAHRHRLRREDLEDCLSQATLELVTRARSGRAFSGTAHVANALEQRFLSRVLDRRRALAGRSAMQTVLEGALPLDGPGDHGAELIDLRADVERLVVLRLELRRLQRAACELTPDQRLVLNSQIALEMDRAEFCAKFGWSFEKYRKVAQRGRARLRALMNVPVVDVLSEKDKEAHL